MWEAEKQRLQYLASRVKKFLLPFTCHSVHPPQMNIQLWIFGYKQQKPALAKLHKVMKGSQTGRKI